MGGVKRTTTLPSPRIEAQLIDTTIRLNKLAVITRRKCGRRGDELATTDNKDVCQRDDYLEAKDHPPLRSCVKSLLLKSFDISRKTYIRSIRG